MVGLSSSVKETRTFGFPTSSHKPVFCADLRWCIRSLIGDVAFGVFSEEIFNPGDVFRRNDSFRGLNALARHATSVLEAVDEPLECVTSGSLFVICPLEELADECSSKLRGRVKGAPLN